MAREKRKPGNKKARMDWQIFKGDLDKGKIRKVDK